MGSWRGNNQLNSFPRCPSTPKRSWSQEAGRRLGRSLRLCGAAGRNTCPRARRGMLFLYLPVRHDPARRGPDPSWTLSGRSLPGQRDPFRGWIEGRRGSPDCMALLGRRGLLAHTEHLGLLATTLARLCSIISCGASLPTRMTSPPSCVPQSESCLIITS